MARPGKPWWWKQRKRWAATLDGKRVLAPPSIGPRDYAAAGAWYEQAAAREEAPISPTSVEQLFEAFLEWHAARVKAGRVSARKPGICASQLSRAANTPLDGRLLRDCPVAEMRGPHLARLLDRWRSEGLALSYCRSVAARVKSVFAWAARPVDGRPPLIGLDPFRGEKLPSLPRAEHRYATRAEAAMWLRWVRKSARAPGFALSQRLLIHTGARPNEILRATAADYRDGVITLDEHKTSEKTGRPRRVFIPRRLHRSMGRALGGRDPAAPIFMNKDGSAWSWDGYAHLVKRLRRSAIAAGLPFQDAGPEKLSNYRWRHTAITTLIQEGVPLAVIAELMGTSVAMIERTYQHLLSSHLGAAAEALGRRKS